MSYTGQHNTKNQHNAELKHLVQLAATRKKLAALKKPEILEPVASPPKPSIQPELSASTASQLKALRAFKSGIEISSDDTLKPEITQTAIVKIRESTRNSKPQIKQIPVVLPAHVIPEEKRSTAIPTFTRLDKDQVSYSDLNEEQKLAVRLAKEGINFVLNGSAGTGKTTTVRVMAQTLMNNHLLGSIPEATKWLTEGSPAIAVVSYTNQAVANIKEALPLEFKSNCLTIHKLLEYSPVYYDISDPETGEFRRTMRFEPKRTATNPIKGIKICVIEEASNVALVLYDKLIAALPHNCIFIYLGDLEQLPPIMDDGILGFKILEYPVVELQHTYRQESDSAIKKLAWRILEGKPINDKELDSFATKGELDTVKFKTKREPDEALRQTGLHFQKLVREGIFDTSTDIVLIPYGKPGIFGSYELCNYIAQEDAAIREVATHEVIVGFMKRYFAIGDIVTYSKQRWKISGIESNSLYAGTTPQLASKDLDRWGVMHGTRIEMPDKLTEKSLDDFFNSLDAQLSEESESAMKQASHVLTLESLESADDRMGESTVSISKTGELSDVALAYALTVHKAQGSEWDKVFCVFHHTHSLMAKREILYTAVTRARKYLRIYYSGEETKPMQSFFQKGIMNQYIKGTGLEAKKEYFKRKLRVRAIKQNIKSK